VGDVAGDLLGVVGAVQLGAEHHLEKGPVGDGEADVGDADLQEAAGGLVGLAEGGGQAPEPWRPRSAGRPCRRSGGRGRFTPGEWMLLGAVALAFLHHLDHVLRLVASNPRRVAATGTPASR
jgi:hypothetical protein